MNLNRETWYSKAIAIFLFFAFSIAAFYLGAKYEKSTALRNTGAVVFSPSRSKVTFQKSYEDNLLKYKGTVEVPSPCHGIRQESKVTQSYPEQVRIDLSVVNPSTDKVCAQQITKKDFSGEVKVSESASVLVFLDGKKVY